MTHPQNKAYICGTCSTPHETFEQAAACHNADFILCPPSDLPADVVLLATGDGSARYTVGRGTFCPGWFVVDNTGTALPTKVYMLDKLTCKLMEYMVTVGKMEYDRGVANAQRQMRLAMGVPA